MASICSKCESNLPEDGRTRKRHRSRRCQACNNKAALERRQNDPIARLQHKLQNNLRKHYAKRAPANLWSRDTVEFLYKKWDKKCVISGETDPANLCIVPAFRTVDPPTRDQLVLLSIRHAMRLARHDKERRLGSFSDEVKAKLELAQ